MTLNLIQLAAVTAVAMAKAQATNQRAWVRAIEKAAEQLASNPYIAEQDGGLLILSYSGETYHANGACQCKAYLNGRPCWHRAAAQLVKRYREAEAKAAAQVAAPAPMVETAATDERAKLIADIKAAHHRARPFESIGLKLHRLFGVTKLEDVSTDDLRKVLAALTSGKPEPPTINKPRRPAIAYHQALDACAKGKGSIVKFYGLAVRAGLTTEQAEVELNLVRARRSYHI
jgi:hypothetical protein